MLLSMLPLAVCTLWTSTLNKPLYDSFKFLSFWPSGSNGVWDCGTFSENISLMSSSFGVFYWSDSFMKLLSADITLTCRRIVLLFYLRSSILSLLSSCEGFLLAISLEVPSASWSKIFSRTISLSLALSSPSSDPSIYDIADILLRLGWTLF